MNKNNNRGNNKFTKSLVLGISIFFILTSILPTLDGQINTETDKTEWLTDIGNNKGTHTVLVEQGTATTCVYCPSMEQYLWQVSGDLEIVALPCSHYTPSQGYTQAIVDRLVELGMGGYPDSFWDGGYTSVGGGQSSVTQLQNAYDACAARTVADIDLYVTAEWLGDGMIDVIVDINNAGSTYNGHLRVYIIEKTSRWITYDGGNFKNALLDFAINKDVTVNAGGSKTETATWNGAPDGFGDIVQSNILVVAAVFSQSTDYTDEVASTNPTTGGSNDPPHEPSDPSPEDEATNVDINTQLSWSGGDPDGDHVDYDVYFGTENPPPKVEDKIPVPNYDPGILNHNEVYYWKIVAYDTHSRVTQGPIWYFVTKENNPPTTPILNGETEGDAGTTYTYVSSATDPNNDNISYLFDWGDGSPTDWLGPHISGETIETNHVWDRRGDYTIKVKARDEFNAESSWSEPINIHIYGPELEIGEITGGIDGIHVEINNIGDGDVNNVNWNISVLGGLLGRIYKSEGGIIPILPTSTTESIFVFGLGNIEIRVETSAPYTNTVTKTATGFIFGIFVIIR